MTKEEIWDKNVPGWQLGMTNKGHANALAAMDEYAKQQSISFMNWTLSSQCDTYNCTDEDQWTNIYTQENITTARLYDIFIEQQNKA